MDDAANTPVDPASLASDPTDPTSPTVVNPVENPTVPAAPTDAAPAVSSDASPAAVAAANASTAAALDTSETDTDPQDGSPTLDKRVSNIEAVLGAYPTADAIKAALSEFDTRLSAIEATHADSASADVTGELEGVKTRLDRLFAHIFGE